MFDKRPARTPWRDKKFDKKNNTVSDKERDRLNRRANREPLFSKKAIERRKASEVQRKKSRWS